jgi:DNA invertase Pin-like site-specific DNA recombinase
MFFNLLATFAEFELDLLRLRTRDGVAIVRPEGPLKGTQPKPSADQRAQLPKLHATGERSISELPQRLCVSRATIYRAFDRVRAQAA